MVILSLRNVPFTFRHTPDEAARFKAATEMIDKIEDQREFFGFDLSRLVAVICQAKKIVEKAQVGTKATHEKIAAWLADNIKWVDRKKSPSKDTVRDLLTVGEFLSKSSRTVAVLQMANADFGRHTIFDEHTKMLIVIQKCTNSCQASGKVKW